MEPGCPQIFSFTNYREYLNSYCQYFLASRQGSLRELCRRCEISSPNYLQQVISNKRNLTSHFALKFASGARLTSLQKDYLLELVRLTHAESSVEKQRALSAMKAIVNRAQKTKVKNADIHGSWVHGVLWELAKTSRFKSDPKFLREILRGSASEDDIAESLRFLVKNGYLITVGSNEKPFPASVDFEPSNDIRRIDLQRSHLRFLQLAQHRINDPIDDREFQGLTIAVKEERFAEVKQRCREFIRQMNIDFSEDSEGDEVLRVQLCVIKLTTPKP